MAAINTGLSSLPYVLKGRSGRAYIARGVVGTFGLKMGNMFLGLIIAILLARSLGVDGYGIYAYVVTVVGVLAIPTQMGLPELVLRQVAQYRARADWGLLRGLVRRANQVVLGAATVFLVTTACIAWSLRENFSNEGLFAFLAALFLLPMLSLTAVRLAILRGLRHPVLGQLPEALIRPLVFASALLLVILVMGPEWLTPVSAVGLSVAATVVAFVAGNVFLKTRMPTETKSVVAQYDVKAWTASAVPFMFIGGTYLLNTKIDIVMLGFFRSSTEVGVYAIAIKLATLVPIGIQSITMVVNAQFAHHWSRDEVQRVQKLATWAARAGLVLVIPVALIFILGGDAVIVRIFGAEFLPGAVPLLILSIGWLAAACLGPVDPLLKMTGHEASAAWAIGYTTAFNIAANLVLIPIYGPAGAGIATALSLVLRKYAMLRYVWRNLGMNPTIMPLRKRVDHGHEKT